MLIAFYRITISIKRFIVSLMLMLAVIGMNAQESLYIIGNDPFGKWNPSVGMQMDYDGEFFSLTVEVPSSVYFSFTQQLASDANAWDEISSYRMAALSNNFAITEDLNGEVIQCSEWGKNVNNAFMTTMKATYTILVDPVNCQMMMTWTDDSTPQYATDITISQTTARIAVGSTLQLSASVSPITVSQAVAWSSSNTAVATVNSNGLVTAKSIGTAIITATTTDGSNKSATCQVTVTAPNPMTDGQTYEEINGFRCVNKWIISRVHSGELAYNALPVATNYARSAVMHDGVVYISVTGAKVVPNDTILQSIVYKYSAEDGTYLGELPLTLNGEPFASPSQSSLQATNIGVDNFGHIWLTGCSSEVNESCPFYLVDPETGALTLLATFKKGAYIARIDYFDVIGDITGEEAQCNIMAPGSNSPTVYAWHYDQGDSPEDWVGGFDGDPSMDILFFWPEEVTLWSYAPMIRQCLGMNPEAPGYYNGDLFYVDAYTTAPILYDRTGTIQDCFDSNYVDPALFPEYGANGVAEFHLDDRNFLVYAKAQYFGDGHGCQINLCEMGEGMTFEGMQKYWQLPADSLGHTSDSGIRLHCIQVEYDIDAQGEELIRLLTYKCQNGFGVYEISKNAGDPEPQGIPGDVNGDGSVDGTDLNILINIILGLDDSYNYNGRANVDGMRNIDGNDLNELITILLGN